MTTDKLSSIAAKVRALLAKAAAGSGATEAEALSAAVKAQELIEKYQLDLTEVEVRAEGTLRVKYPLDAKGIDMRLGIAVAAFTETKCWVSTSEHTGSFLGLRSDAEFAGWLMSHLRGFIERAALDFSFSDENVSKDGVNSFIIGATERINQRLHAEVAKRRAAAMQNMEAMERRGALVVLKGALIMQAFQTLGIHLHGSVRLDNSFGRRDAHAAGQVAGDRAGFGRPINGPAGGPVKLIRSDAMPGKLR